MLGNVLKGQPAAEVEQRVQMILKKLKKAAAPPEQVGVLRSVEVLEQIGSAEAQQLLKALANGAPEARLTEDAKAAVGRLAKRAVVTR